MIGSDDRLRSEWTIDLVGIRSHADGETGMVTGLQRFGGALNLHVHMHTLVLDGVYVADSEGRVTFYAAPALTDADVQRVVGQVRRRILRLLGQRGIDLAQPTDDDGLAEESAALAGFAQAAVLGRAPFGRRRGRGPERVGGDPDAPWVERSGPLQAIDHGFDLHAAVRIPAGDRSRLERLCRYVFRPPVGQHRLRRLADGRVALALQREWADGTTHLVFTPQELLARLVPLVPRPRVNVCLYHGVLAPNSRWRRAVVPSPVAVAAGAACGAGKPEPSALASPSRRPRPKYRAWADLMEI
jgi:Putative transposase